MEIIRENGLMKIQNYYQISKKGIARLKLKIDGKILSKDYPIQIFRLAGIYSKENNLLDKNKKNNIRIIRKKTIIFFKNTFRRYCRFFIYIT